MIEMKSLNGFEIVDAKAREDIEIIKQNGTGGGGSADLSNYYTKDETYSKTEIDNKGYLTTLPEHTHDQYLTEHQSLSNYYTKSETYSKTEVDNAIANIPTGGGDGVKVIVFTHTSFSSMTEDEKAEAVELFEYLLANNNPDNYVVYIKNIYRNNFLVVSEINYNADTLNLYSTTYVDSNILERTQFIFTYKQNGDSRSVTNLSYGYNQLYDFNNSGGSGGSDWTITDELYGDNIYNAKEIIIRMRITNTDTFIHSHFICNPVFDEKIGTNYQQKNFAFTTPDSMDNRTPTWSFDGWNLNINCDYSYSDVLVAYKQ